MCSLAMPSSRIEKDAVIGAWNESDLRSSTNVLNHKLSFAYTDQEQRNGSIHGMDRQAGKSL